MSKEQTRNVAVMAGLMAVGLGCMAVFFLGGSANPSSAVQGASPLLVAQGPPPMPGMPPMQGMPPMSGKPSMSPMSGKPGMPGAGAATSRIPVVAKPALPDPPKPISVKDPFVGGQPRPKGPSATSRPPQIRVQEIMPFTPTPRQLQSMRGRGLQVRDQQKAIGRLAGWIYNSNGQIVAIFEDSSGVTKAIHVGDQIGDYRVKAIAADHVVLVNDATEEEMKLRLQNLQKPGATINAVPATAPIANW